ncbi:MAG: hypothetical protein JOZ69_19225 [Myxococcales bacterium]|nr:hypothetical protein [Myxococcales bacterium]
MRQRECALALASAAALVAVASCAADAGDVVKSSSAPDAAAGLDAGAGTSDEAAAGDGTGGGADAGDLDGDADSAGSVGAGGDAGVADTTVEGSADAAPEDGATAGLGQPGMEDARGTDGGTVNLGIEAGIPDAGTSSDGESDALTAEAGAGPDSGGDSAGPDDAATDGAGSGGSCLVAGCPLRVQWQTPTAAANTIAADLNIINAGTAAIDLSAVRVRYFFTADGDPALVFNCDYAGYFQSNMSGFSASGVSGTFLAFQTAASPLVDTVLELSFASAPLPPGAAVSVNFRIHDVSFATNYDQTNDWSRVDSAMSGSAYVDADGIAAYLDGTLAWGAEPGATPSAGSTD